MANKQCTENNIKIDFHEEAEKNYGAFGNPYLAVKRGVDLILSIILIIFLIFPIVCIALAIRLESRGNPIFTQKRVGRHGKPFTMYKLRTMRIDPKKTSPNFAAVDDVRVTKFGKLLRRTRIDETPQLFNVLIGNMSLIGPRPEQMQLMPRIYKEIPSFALREIVRPGITGWAQVNQGYADDIESSKTKLEYDVYYIKHVSLLLDLRILWLTFGTVINGHGAR